MAHKGAAAAAGSLETSDEAASAAAVAAAADMAEMDEDAARATTVLRSLSKSSLLACPYVSKKVSDLLVFNCRPFGLGAVTLSSLTPCSHVHCCNAYHPTHSSSACAWQTCGQSPRSECKRDGDVGAGRGCGGGNG